MVEGGLVEDEEVGCGCEDVVDDDAKQPVACVSRAAATTLFTTKGAYHVMRYSDSSWRRQSSRAHWLM